MSQATAERKLRAARQVPPDPAAELAEAERELAESSDLLEAVEKQLARGDAVPPERHHELRDLRRFGELRCAGIRARIEAARREERLVALRAVAEDARALAESGPLSEVTRLEGALAGVAAAVARVRELAGEHDRRQRALVDRAAELGAGDLSPSGRPRQASASVAVTGMATGMVVTAGDVRLAAVGGMAERAIDAAVHDRAGEGVELLRQAVRRQNHSRAPFYLLDVRSRMVFPAETLAANSAMAQGIRDHRLRELKPAEIDAYLAGEEIPGDDAA